MKEWYTPSELASLKLPGLPSEHAGISAKAERDDWRGPSLKYPDNPKGTWRKRPGRGGGYKYHISVLPDEARRELEYRAKCAETSRQLAVIDEPAERQKDIVPVTDLTARQRQVMEARAAILLELDRRILVGKKSRNMAVTEFVAQAKLGELDDDLSAALATANASRQQLCRATVYNWLALRERSGVPALAPALSKKQKPLPIWWSEFFPYYARPQKPTVTRALLNWQRANPDRNESFPTVRQIRIAIGKLGEVEKMRGRLGAQSLKALQAYKVRDTSDLLPTSVYVADGKTFDAEVAHPRHGKPFRPEITTIIDAHTRKIPGWSVSLDENTIAVVDALRVACCRHGIPATFYTDRGPGYKNKKMDAPLTGFLGRLDITPMRVLPYNSQAKGLIERFNRFWTDVARDFPTYINRDMDREASNHVHKQTRKDAEDTRKDGGNLVIAGEVRRISGLLPTWQQFIARIEREIEDYNNRPHSSLPRISDPETGKQRFMSPNEMWQAAVDRGFSPITVTADEENDLFRPWETRVVQRCMINLYTNSYFAIELEEFHGREVIVAFDIHDASRIWVREIDLVDGERQPGRLIAVAEFEGNKTRYVPVSFEQRTLETRAKGRKKRLHGHLDEVDDELHGRMLSYQPVKPVIEASWTPVRAPEPLPVGQTRAEPKPEAAAIDPEARPSFDGDIDWARWVTANPDKVLPSDREHALILMKRETARDLLRSVGVDVEVLKELARSAA